MFQLSLKLLGFISLIIVIIVNKVNTQYLYSINFFGNAMNVRYTPGPLQTQFRITCGISATSIPNFWIGIGFNNVSQKIGGNALICRTDNSVPSLEHDTLPGYYLPPYVDPHHPTRGLSSVVATVSSTTLICSFTRNNSDLYPGYFDMSGIVPYMFAAAGPTLDGVLQTHSYLTTTTSFISYGTMIANSGQSSNNANTTTSNAIYSGSLTTGNFKIQWTDSATYTDFIFTYNGVYSSSRKKRDVSLPVIGIPDMYIAFGLSNDKNMGDDCVMACRIYNNTASIEHYYNDGQMSTILFPGNNSIGLSNLVLTSNNNGLTCSFRRVKSMPEVDNYFDLNNRYYILVAKGPSNSSGILYHDSSKSVTKTRINFQSNTDYNVAGPGRYRSTTNGCILVIAWFFIKFVKEILVQ